MSLTAPFEASVGLVALEAHAAHVHAAHVRHATATCSTRNDIIDSENHDGGFESQIEWLAQRHEPVPKRLQHACP